jgi:hypothetical protein
MMKKLWRGFCFTLLILMVISSSIAIGRANSNSVKDQKALQSGPGADYWPKAEWRRSTPEEQGVDSERLYRMISYLQADQKEIHSLLIIRNGYLITDAYFFTHIPRILSMRSIPVPKSITSALMGIAIGENYIKGVDEKVLSYFSDRKIDAVDARKEALTLKHLLMINLPVSKLRSKPFPRSLEIMFGNVKGSRRKRKVVKRWV